MEKQLSFIDMDIIDCLSKCSIVNLETDQNDDSVFYDYLVSDFKYFFRKTASSDIYNVGWSSGATKGVLIFTAKEQNNGFEDFVLKIPFRYVRGDGYETEDGDYECDSYELCGSGAYNGESWNYCQTELEEYERAKARDVEGFFADTRLYAKIDNYPVYYQEYATVYRSADDTTHTHTREDEKRVSDLCYESGCEEFNTDWLSDAFVYFGEEKFYNFLTFIDYEGIEDLHNNNIGYAGMRPVLIDFSSYND